MRKNEKSKVILGQDRIKISFSSENKKIRKRTNQHDNKTKT